MIDSYITKQMVWSYSRITTYEDCKYKFYMRYIKGIDEKKLFFAEYGTFIHTILEKYYKGELKKNELVGYYLAGYCKNVSCKAPSANIFQKYFTQGLEYLKNIDVVDELILGVEKNINFNINSYKFTGYIDKLSKTDTGLVITDNKSRILKSRTNRKKPTLSDIELDEYLRQLYIYSIAVKNEYGEFPYKLAFNCFRSGEIISENFDTNAYDSTIKWATNLICQIESEKDWTPNIEKFKCKYLCGLNEQCEYYQLFK